MQSQMKWKQSDSCSIIYGGYSRTEEPTGALTGIIRLTRYIKNDIRTRLRLSLDSCSQLKTNICPITLT